MKPRLRAFLIHLTGSILLATVAVALVFLIWYPAPLHLATGVTAIFFLIIGVDVVIGPVLTLIVYVPGKWGLRFDLVVIVVAQLIALGYGLATVAEGRPAWLVFNADRFDLVRAHELDESRMDKTPAEYQHPSWFGPQWVAAHNPSDPEERNTLTFESVFAGIDLPQRPDLYQPLAAETGTIREKALPLEQLRQYNSDEAVESVLTEWPEADAWLPMMAPVKPLTVLLIRDTAEVVKVVDLNPWD